MTSSAPIALDAMGGDHAPAAIIEGAVAAAEAGVDVILVGPPADLGTDHGLEVSPASEVIAMDADPARSVRTMKDSSLVRAAELVRDGEAAAMVSAGNTGAAVASSLLRMGRIRGVARPGIATPIPVPGSTPTVLLDAGAMADCQADWLVQYAVMGSLYATKRFGIETPRVGLLSIGEEPGKGNALVKETYPLLDAAPVNFIGNVEGRDVMTDLVDVIVCDGYTGNIVLKTLEGGMRAFTSGVLTALGGLADGGSVALEALAPFAAEMNPDFYGGAALLGVDGVSIISHGSSSPVAITNALIVANDLVGGGLVDALRSGVAALAAEPSSGPAPTAVAE